MKEIASIKRLGCLFFLGALLTIWGCESVGIVERENIARRGYGDRRDRDRYDRYDREQVYGTVRDIDERRREIEVRTEDGRTMTVRYNNNTQVYNGGRDLRVTSLRSGDRVSIRFDRASGGERYAEVIRIEDPRDARWSR